MVNGVLEIVAAVLFAVIAIKEDMNMLWLCIAGIYLVAGVLNLVVYAIRSKRSQKAARAEGAREEKEKAEKAKAEKEKLEATKTEKTEIPGGNTNG